MWHYIYGENMIKHVIIEQYRSKIDQLIGIPQVNRPKEGWIRTMRKALGMSSPQLAKQLDISKSQVSQMERMEVEDRITIKQLRRVANRLDCDLYYALVPHKPVKEMVRERAKLKASDVVKRTDMQMKLESQQLSSEKLKRLLETEIERMVKESPRDLWED